VALLWFLAYGMKLATLPIKEVQALVEDIGDFGEADLRRRTTLPKPGA
jgi:hypothetical protein